MVQSCIEDFCSVLSERAPQIIEPLVTGEQDIVGKEQLKQDPEQFISQHLVWPICDAMGYNYIVEGYLEGQSGFIDIYIQNTSPPLLCEVKRVNCYKRAVRDLRDYHNHTTMETSYGIATDGLNWVLMWSPDDQRKNPDILAVHSFRGAVFAQLIADEEIPATLQGERVYSGACVEKVLSGRPLREYNKLRLEPPAKSARRFEENFSLDQLSSLGSGNDFDRSLEEFSNERGNGDQNTTLQDF